MAPSQFLLIPDSVSDRILLFDASDGSLVNDNFIDGSADGLGIFQTPLNAIQVNNEIWVSDQVADALFRFDLEGNYLGIVGDNDNDGDTDGLDNIRGIEFANGQIYVANSGSDNNAPGDGEVVVVFDANGNNLGFFDTGDPFDIQAYNGQLLISDVNSDSSGGEDIDVYTLDGVNSTFFETLVESEGVTGIDFPQQITVRDSNANLLVVGFSAPGGLYEFDADGNSVDLLDAEDGFANRIRAGYELGNGNIIWSGGDGVIFTNPTTGEDVDIYTVNNQDFRPGARFIEPLVLPPTDPSDLTGAVFLGDQGLDQLLITQDFSGDSDANDALEASVYFDANNASGLEAPTENIFSVLQADLGFVYYGDGTTDSVYRLFDLNQDRDAQDAGEATVWFSEENVNGFTLPTPNGLAQGSDNAIYIVNAGVASRPTDAVYRTQDLNGDGDANDTGESSLWLDLQALNPSSSAFDIEFSGDVAYISDLVGGDDDVIYRAADTNGNGTIDDGEATVFIDDANTLGVPLDFGIAVDGDDLYTWESLDFSGPQSVYRLRDRNGSNTIDAANEAFEVWNTDAIPGGFASFSGFSIAVNENRDLVITSNGQGSENNVFLLRDRNQDGDYFDADETIPYLASSLNGTTPDRARAVEFAKTPTTPTNGSNKRDFLRGTLAADLINGLEGNDFIRGRNGDDLINGNEGKDRLLGGRGNDTLFGGDGRDLLLGNQGNDLLNGGAEDDQVRGNQGNDVLLGDAGADFLSGGKGNDILRGGTGDDTLNGGQGDDQLFSGAGRDFLRGGSGHDQFWVAVNEVPADIVEISASESYYTFGPDVSDNSGTRLLADKAADIGFPDLQSIAFLGFDTSELPLGKLQEDAFQAELLLEQDSALAPTLIPSTDDRPVSLSTYEITAPFSSTNGNLNDIDYGPNGANAISTTSVGDDGIYSWDVTSLVNDELISPLDSALNVALSGLFGNENIDDRNSYGIFHPVGATEGLVPTLALKIETIDVIADFTSGEDVIGLTGLGVGFEDLNFTQQGRNTLISLDGTDFALLRNVDVTDLSSDDFVFA